MYVTYFKIFSAAVISDSESPHDGSAPTSVTSDKHGSSGYASLIAEINALDFSDAVTSVTLDRTGENIAVYVIIIIGRPALQSLSKL